MINQGMIKHAEQRERQSKVTVICVMLIINTLLDLRMA